MPKPVVVSFGKSVFDSVTSPKTVSVTWQIGDILVVIGGNEDGSGGVLGLPTSTGLTFVKNQNLAGDATHCAAYVATAVAANADTQNVSATCPGGGARWGFGVWLVRASSGVGTSTSQNTATKTKAMTSTKPNSCIIWGAFDFGVGSVYTGTPTPTNARESAVYTLEMTTWLGELDDQPSVASVSYGVTGGGSTGPYAIVIQEIKGQDLGFSDRAIIQQAVHRASNY